MVRVRPLGEGRRRPLPTQSQGKALDGARTTVTDTDAHVFCAMVAGVCGAYPWGVLP